MTPSSINRGSTKSSCRTAPHSMIRGTALEKTVSSEGQIPSPRPAFKTSTKRWPMRRRAIWTIWLNRMMGLIGTETATGTAPDFTLQQQAAARVPLPEVPESLRPRVRQVIERPTLFSHGPAEAFSGWPALYDWLLDHPDRAVIAWRRLGATCTEITDCGAGRFVWKDGQGSEINWQTIHNTPALRIW